MFLCPIFIFLNIIYNVTTLSIFVKISWRGNQIEAEQYLASKNTHRFHVELTNDKWDLPTDGETDKYDTFHFEEVEENNEENSEKYSLKVYKALDEYLITEIVSIDNVEDNSLIYIKYKGKNKTSCTKIFKKDEEYFNTIINLIKRPVRFIQFIFKTKRCKEGVVTIKCKNEDNNDKIAEINIPEREKCGKVVALHSQIVKTRVCPDDKYVFTITKNVTKVKYHKHREFTLECQQALNENNNLNIYEFNILNRDKKGKHKTKSTKTECLLDKNKFEMIDESKGDFINLLSDNEKNAEEKLKEYIGEAKTFDVKGKGKNVVMTSLKINENEPEPQEENLPSGHFNQNHDDQIKGKGKEPIMVESDEETEYTNPKINEKHDDTKPDKEYLEIIEPSEIKNLDDHFVEEKGKNIVTAPLEINKDEQEQHKEEFHSGLNNQKQNDQSKGRVKLLKKVKVLKFIKNLWRILIKLLKLSIQTNLTHFSLNLAKEKGKNAAVAPLIIKQNEHEPHKGVPSEHSNQNQNNQSKVKDKIIEKSEGPKTYREIMEDLHKTFGIKHSNEYLDDAVLQFLPNKDELHHQKPNSLLGKHKRDGGY
uniref:Uncharacterized protein n=1 Tax=Meloidogyne enterolobii TaxID=390850 RepID=A0A6V7UGZ8_MELEN|nr:unnamed protein product [Meloidogyne enterolobii]